MDLGSIFLLLALLILVGLFVSRPLVERRRAEANAEPDDRQRSALLAERDRVLIALQELDFDFALGKIPEQDYPLQRETLVHQGADVLRQLDAMQPESSEDDAEARLEAAIAARRADAAASQKAGQRPVPGNGRKQVAVASPDDDLEVLLANRRRVRQEKAGGFCPQCGGALQKSDRFCPKCGTKIA